VKATRRALFSLPQRLVPTGERRRRSRGSSGRGRPRCRRAMRLRPAVSDRHGQQRNEEDERAALACGRGRSEHGSTLSEACVVRRPSPIGVLSVYATRTGVCAIRFDGEATDALPPFSAKEEGSGEESDAFPGFSLAGAMHRELAAYFEGKLTQFETPLDTSAISPFARRTLITLAKVAPFGHVIEYGELARRVGRPGGGRAIGGAMGSNPIPIVLPCHRVVASGNQLGGFSGGLPRKRVLLGLEGFEIRDDVVVPRHQMTLPLG
jgi:methylated-DNA-[protein]-cysteine S-methyltransferase